MTKQDGSQHAVISHFWLRVRRFLVGLVILGVLVASVYFFRDELLALLQKNDTLWTLYLHVSHQLHNKTLLGLFYAGFFGSFFFIFIPLEPLYLYYLSLDYFAIIVTMIMITSSIGGLVFDYGCGRILGRFLISRKDKEKFEKRKKRIERFGGFILLLTNIIPFLPVQWVCVFYGGVHYNFKKFLIYTFVGRSAYIFFLWYASVYLHRLVDFLI